MVYGTCETVSENANYTQTMAFSFERIGHCNMSSEQRRKVV